MGENEQARALLSGRTPAKSAWRGWWAWRRMVPSRASRNTKSAAGAPPRLAPTPRRHRRRLVHTSVRQLHRQLQAGTGPVDPVVIQLRLLGLVRKDLP